MTEMGSPREILLVDDDVLDAAILRRVFRDLGWANRLVHMTDGRQVLAYLKGRDGETPGVILLDLNMPNMTGFEFLERIKADDGLQGIPVVVVTTSDERQDRAKSFALGAAAYVVKSLCYNEFRQSIRAIGPYLAPAAART